MFFFQKALISFFVFFYQKTCTNYCSLLMTILMRSKQKGGDASEDEQVAEDEELGAAVEEGPQAPPG